MRIQSGKLVIIGMLTLSVGAALFSLWFRHARTYRSLALWGPQAALLVERGGHVTALRFDPPLAAAASDPLASAAELKDASQARGIQNIRHALVDDSTFDWQTAPAAEPPTWSWGLQFSEGPEALLVVFDPAAGVVGNYKTGGSARLDPLAQEDFSLFFREQFGPAP